MTTVRVDFRAKKATKRVRQIQQRLNKGIPTAMKATSLAIQGEVLESFRTKRSPWGRPWKPLSDTTISLAARGAFGPKRSRSKRDQLEDTGLMKGGIVPASTAHSASVKATGPHARAAWVQQLGNRKNRLPNTRGPIGVKSKTGKTWTLKPRKAPIPARPFMPLIKRGGKVVPKLPKQLRQEIVATIKQALFQGKRGSGRIQLKTG